MKFSKDGLLAKKKDPREVYAYGVVYGHKVLRGTTEFEVEIASYGTGWSGTLKLGVMQHKAGSEIKLEEIPRFSQYAKNYACSVHTGSTISSLATLQTLKERNTIHKS